MQEMYKQIQDFFAEPSLRWQMQGVWEEIVNIESGTLQVEGVSKVSAVLEREMNAVGIKTRHRAVKNAADILIGEWNTESKAAPLVLLGHMDTVFKAGAVAENPFRVDENNMAHGPGCLDMKAGIVMGVFVVKALASLGWNKRPIKLVYASDEENLHMFSDAKSILAEELTGALAVFNFETGYMDDRFVVGRKGGGPVTIKVHGVASHSGIAPEKGRSAILEAANKIVEIEAQNDFARGRLINCGMVEGGLGENTIPDAATIRIGIRFPDNAIRNEIFDILKAATEHSSVADTTAELDLSRVMPSMDTTDKVMKLFAHVQKVAAECGYGKIGSFQVGGLSDSNIAVSCGVPALCGMGVRGEFNHTTREYADVESFFTRTALAACAAATLEDDFT